MTEPTPDGDLEFYQGIRAHGVPGVHEFIVDRLATVVPTGGHVLDLACGAGALSQRLLDAGYQVTACDSETDKVRLDGRAVFKQVDLNQDFAASLDAKFDAVVASEIVEHLENPRHFLRQAGKLIGPEGQLFLTTPNIESAYSKAVFIATGYFNWFMPQDYEESGHIVPFTRTLLAQALAETGYDTLHWDYVGDVDRTGWWKVRLLSRLIGAISTPPDGEVMFVQAKPKANAL